MRILVALALLAVAFADEVQVAEPVDGQELFEYVPYDGPEINDVVSPLEDAPVDAPVEALQYAPDEGLETKFDDSPLDFDTPIADDGIENDFDVARAYETGKGLEVNFDDSPLDFDAPVDAPIADEGLELNFVEVPLDFAPEPFTLDEAPLPAFEANDAVQVADPEPIVLGEAPVPAFETAPTVEAVKIAVPQLPEYLGKQFADPRLR